MYHHPDCIGGSGVIAEERETTITYTDADKSVSIYTCRRQDITALKRKLARGVVLEAEGNYPDGTAWARFTLPRNLWRIGNAVKRASTRTTVPWGTPSTGEG